MKVINIPESKKIELIKNLQNSDPNSQLLDTFNSMKFFELDGSENKFICYEGTGKYIIHLDYANEIEVLGWDPLQAYKIANYCCKILNNFRLKAVNNKLIIGIIPTITENNRYNWICSIE